MKPKKKENEKKKKIEKPEKDLREKVEAWEKSVPSHKDIKKEEKFENKIEKILLSEQPSGLLLCNETVPSRIRALTKSRSKSTAGESKSTQGVAWVERRQEEALPRQGVA